MIRSLTILCALFLVVTASTFAQDYWWETEISATFADLDGLQAVDFDMDGDPDIVAYSTSSGAGVSWWENDGNAEFARHALGNLPDNLTDVQVIDFDQDGDQDLLAVRADASVLWLENTGGLTFTTHTLISELEYRVTFTVTDFDNDTDLDLLVTDWGGIPYGSGEVYWLEATGDGQFDSHQILEGATFERVVAADLDNDGDKDLITAEQSLDEPYYRLVPRENLGYMVFTAHDIIPAGGQRVQLDCVDMDLDGDLDIVQSSFYVAAPYNYTLWYRSDGGFSFTGQENQELGIYNRVACVSDLDEDGDPDLILEGAPTAAYINDGSGNLTAEVISTFSANLCADVADLDGDGSLDIVHGTRCDELVWSKRSVVEQPTSEFVLANCITNFGGYSEPNAVLPSGEFPQGSGIYYFWGCDFWAGAKVGDEHHVSHSDYGNYEFKPSESGGSRPDLDYVLLGYHQWQYDCSYDDFEPVGGHTPLGLQIDQSVIAPRTGQGPTGAHLVQQTLTNTSDTQLDSVYAGWKFDMDIAAGPNGHQDQPHIDDMCSYDPDTQIAYMWDADDPQSPWDDTGEFGWIPGYAGIKLLDGPTETAAFQWWDWDGDPGTDLEKFQYMAGIHPGSYGAFKAEPDTVWDYRVLITTGPFTLMPGESVDLTMTYAVGYGFDDLVDTISEMEAFWLSAPETQPGTTQPLSFSLGEPYPNPFNASVMIPFQLDQRGHATIAVTDILGRRVATLVDGVRSPCQHRVTFTGDDLASGVYFVTLTSGQRATQARKIVFMK